MGKRGREGGRGREKGEGRGNQAPQYKILATPLELPPLYCPIFPFEVPLRAGTSQYPALWLSHMSLKPPERQGRHQNWRPLAIEAKYAGIVGRHMFEPIAVETLGVSNASAIRLLNDLGRRISSISGYTRETSHSASFGGGAALQCCSATRQPPGP